MNKTYNNSSSKDIDKGGEVNKSREDGLTVREIIDMGSNIKKMEGMITGEIEKALRIIVNNGNEIWIPKSTIKSQYTFEMNTKQIFLIDSWILEKNNLIKQEIS